MERIYVHESVLDSFTDAFVAKTKALKLGAGLDYHVDVGSLTTEDQLKTITAHVEDARAKGATVLTGGQPRPELGPLFYEPTVLTGVTPEMTVYAEETFGPVVSIYGYATVDEAIERANDSRYGLNASVWTQSRPAGEQVAARLHAGTVNINDGFAASFGSVDAPMGDSGVGRRNGTEGLHKYTEPQTIAAQRVMPLRPPKAIPQRMWTSALTGALKVLKRLPR